MEKKQPSFRSSGHSLIEFAIASFLILTVLVSIFEVFSLGQQAAVNLEAEVKALLLARDLLEEISGKAFEEPGAPGSFGRESGERRGDRRRYDDVDDYDGYGPYKPPLDIDGTALADFPHFTQAVSVDNVLSTDFDSVRSDGSTPFKRVRVSIQSATLGEAAVTLERIVGKK